MTFYSASNPFMQIFNLQGTGLNDGDVYFGVAGQDPITNPKTVYWDFAGTEEADQPIPTTGGYLYRSGTPAEIYLDSTYSIKVLDKKGGLVYYQANVFDPVFELGERVDEINGPNGGDHVGFTQNGTGAVVTTVGAVLRELAFTLSEFGGGTGLSDNTAAFNKMFAAMAANNGGRSFIAPGLYNVDSASLGTAIQGCSHVDMFWEGVTVKVTGTGQTLSLFNFDNCSNIAFYGRPKFVGNSVATGYNNGAAISAALTSGGTADMINLQFDVDLDNFAAPYWINVENDNATYVIDNVRGLVRFTSRTGNSIQPSMVTYNAAAVCANGFAGYVTNVDFIVIGDANYIKSGINYFNRVRHARLGGNVLNAGVAGATDDAGAYAYMNYDPSYNMSDIYYDNPRATAPRSVGCYSAGAKDVTWFNPVISGQTDTNDGTLFKAAIAWVGTIRPTIIGGNLSGNYNDLQVSPPSNGEKGDGRVVGLRTAGATGTSVKFSYFPAINSSDYLFEGCQIAGSGLRTVSIQNSLTARIDNIEFRGGFIRSDNAATNAYALDIYVDSGSAADGYVFDTRILGYVRAQAQTGTLTFSGSIEGPSTSGAALATMVSCTKLRLFDLTISGIVSGAYAFNTGSSTGISHNLQFPQCVGGLVLDSTSLGGAKPTFSGNVGDVVQNLTVTAVSPQGSAASQYTVADWICGGTTTWNDRRALTGT